ncbi:CPBP family intramembrane glutamic endopeptidase [Metabacillus lacus]|uniref:CPBP family intramembrane glutamic endopeptidase n=1 Tax=Metabacillus lacus TaxID=1983721 RepID=UPI001478EB38|nr:type II CAAX endopeptidase family protein [Metabacillus lacus]
MLLVSIAALFFGGIASISYHQEVFTIILFMGFVILFFTSKEKRFVILLMFSFLISYLLFISINDFVKLMDLSKGTEIILNRLFLVLIILGISGSHLYFNNKVSWFNERPNWKNSIVLPFHELNIFWFWMIGIIINVVIYIFIIVQKDIEYIQSLILFGLIFSIMNAVFEEVIWRGILLTALTHQTSTRYAVLLTSIGFGLSHLSIGFSMSLSLLISVAGVIYALITLKTNSIYPSIVFHFIVNIGMVFSGFII